MHKLDGGKNNNIFDILKNIHFWIILIILFLLLYIYHLWPWYIWQINHSPLAMIPWFFSLHNLALWESKYQFFGALFFIPIIYACIIFKWRGVLTITLLTVIGIAPILLGLRLGNGYFLLRTFLLLLPIVVTIVINLELDLRRRDKYLLVQRERERRLYLSKVLEAQDKERKRISQELHDDTIQNLLALANYAEAIQSTESNIVEKQNNGALIRTTALQTVENLRRLTLNLNPRLLDELGLVPALNWLVNTMNSEGKIRYKLMLDGDEHKLPSQVEVSLFRTIQEALNNVKKHSQASKATIEIKFSAEYLQILIEDNGQGFSPVPVPGQLAVNGKFGIIGMRERVESLGGTFSIKSNPNEGTTLIVRIKY